MGLNRKNYVFSGSTAGVITMRTEKEIRDNIESWEEIRKKAVAQDEMTIANEANLVINELEWVLEE